MLSFEEARAKAAAYLTALDDRPYGGTVIESQIIDAATQVHDFGWVFSYQDRRYLEKGDINFALGGNAPLLVDRFTGQLHVLGTGRPQEEYVQNYLLTGDPHREPAWRMALTGHMEIWQSAPAVRLLRDALGLHLGVAKRAIDQAIAGATTSFDVASQAAGVELAKQLSDMGFTSRMSAS